VADSRHACPASTVNEREARMPLPCTIDVLLVSGNRTYANAARLALGAQGCRVTTALDGASALAMMPGARFALLLVDERLPDIEGPQLLARLLAQAQDAHVIMLMTETSAAAVARALDAGARAVYPRPAAASGLAVIVRREASLDSPLLDAALIDELRVAIAGPDARGALLTRFAGETQALWSAAHEALVAGQTQVLATALHRLRGATAGIGALACERRLASLAIRVDGPLPDRAEWEACRALLEQSVEALRRVLA